MMGVQYSLDQRQYAEIERLFDTYPKEASKLSRRVLWRVGKYAVTVVKRPLARELGVKQGTLIRSHRFGARKGRRSGKAISVTRSGTELNPEVHVRIAGSRIPVGWFRAKQLWKSARRRRAQVGGPAAMRRRAGVSWKIGKRARVKDPQAFIAAGRRGGGGTKMGVRELGTSGHIGVFKRLGRKRLPIYPPRGPSVPHVATKSPQVGRAITVDVSEMMDKRLTHELDRLMAKLARKGGG